jgi:hypothetical protein
MINKIYIKRGKHNYKEKKLTQAIEKILQQRAIDDPEIYDKIKPARNFQELELLHREVTTIDKDYVEVNDMDTDNDTNIDTNKNKMKEDVEVKEEVQEQPKTTSSVSNTPVIDPFNDAEPIVRDYVMENAFEEETDNQGEDARQTFDEPTSFQESFELPPNINENKDKGTKRESQPKAEPINPKFNEMDGNRKRRSTKKFARMIVEGVSILAEKGCIWWVTKDITEDKLVQYEIEDSVDLQILLTLEHGQQITVREWFKSKCGEAEVVFKVSKEDKDDLIESLFEVMMEKGISPTPMQELMINAAKTFILDMGIKAWMMNREIKNVLAQLKDLKNSDVKSQDVTNDYLKDDDNEDLKNPAIIEPDEIEVIPNDAIATT